MTERFAAADLDGDPTFEHLHVRQTALLLVRIERLAAGADDQYAAAAGLERHGFYFVLESTQQFLRDPRRPQHEPAVNTVLDFDGRLAAYRHAMAPCTPGPYNNRHGRLKGNPMSVQSEGKRPPQPADDAAAQQLLTIIQGLVAELHRRESAPGTISLGADLDRDLGMDSLARVELLHRIEKSFGVTLAEREVVEARTAREVLGMIAGAAVSGRVPADHQVLDTGPRRMVGAAPYTASTLLDVLEWHAAVNPERTHIRLYDDQAAGETLDYRALFDGARRKAAALQSRGVGAGQPVVLMLQTGRDYFECFLGALLAGGIPVPIYPPARPSQIEDHVRRQQGILENSAASVMITLTEARSLARLMRSQVATLSHVVTPDELDTAAASDYVRPTVKPDDLALIQYTSGSTGTPKGVMLTHANLLTNIRSMAAQIGARSEDVFVSWLPLYHDMGLIGAWLGSLYCASEFVVMSPLAFIARPERWLWAIHRHRATLSASPNFGYELCLRRLDDADLEGLDLRSWRIAFNGAEPVSPETIRRFRDRFSRYGLRPTALTPVYGLAECSLGLTFPPRDRGPVIDRVRRDVFLRDGRAIAAPAQDATALEFVGCGSCLPEHELRVVDAGGRELPDREVGSLQFRGPSATQGYYRNPEATRTLMRGGWLDSGDLAYTVSGEVYLTGRAKDLIIHAGRNLYPHEIEEAIGNLPGIRAGRVAAFGARDPALGTERLIVVAETRSLDEAERRGLTGKINDIVAILTGGPPDEVALAPPGTILKTPSGKVRRTAIRDRYERGDIMKAPPPAWRQLLKLFIESVPARAHRAWRRMAALGYGLYALVLFVLVAAITWFAVVLLPGLTWRWRATRLAARILALLSGMRLTIQGELPAGGRTVVFVSNHASYLDGAFLIMALRRPASFVAKGEFRANFVIRTFLTRIGARFVERLDARQGVEDTRELARAVRDGTSLVFFPEGTFTRAAGLRPFRMGAFMTAAAARAPVVPLALRGTRSLLRSGSWWPSPGKAELTIGAPIPADEGAQNDWARAVTLRDRARADILRHCGEPDFAGDRTRPWLGESE